MKFVRPRRTETEINLKTTKNPNQKRSRYVVEKKPRAHVGKYATCISWRPLVNVYAHTGVVAKTLIQMGEYTAIYAKYKQLTLRMVVHATNDGRHEPSA